MRALSDCSTIADALILYGEPLPVASRGSHELLRLSKRAVFSSRRCPPERMIAALDWARSLPQAGTALVGGFHSPMEQECLSIALDRRLAVIVCVARDLDTMRISKAWLQAMNNGRMLLLSTFLPSDRRLTEERSHERNRFAALLADEIFIVHADRGSHTEQLGTYARTKGKRLVAPA